MNTLEQFINKKPVLIQLARFIAIGLINTALDFAFLNALTKYFGVHDGVWLGVLNLISFSLAVIQSYFWNKHWTFSNIQVSLLKNFGRLIVVGFLGGIVILAVLIGSKFQVNSLVYFALFALLLIGQVSIWHGFNIGKESNNATGNPLEFG